MGAKFTPADFVMSCIERGYSLEIKDGAPVFTATSFPTAKVQNYLQQYSVEVAAYLQGVNQKPVEVRNDFNDFNGSVIEKEAESAPFTLPEVIHRPFCDAVLAIMEPFEWEQLFAVFRYSLDSHHVIDLAKHLQLPQDTLQKALDELVKRRAIRRSEGYPGSVCLHVPFVGSHGVPVPAVFYRGWPGNMDLSQLVNDVPDAEIAPDSRSSLNINVPASDTGHSEQFALEGLG